MSLKFLKNDDGPNNNVDLDWMNDKIRYEETAEEADSVYMKGKER